MLNIRYYFDEELDCLHIHKHNVYENEVEDILTNPIEDRQGKDGSRVALGKTSGGRFLKVIYVPDTEPDSVFVITSYDLSGKALAAFKKRRKKKK